jgi:hypothetical protein
MKVTLLQSLGSYRKGTTVNVNKAAARVLARAGKVILGETSAKPAAKTYARRVEAPKSESSQYESKAELVHRAHQLGIRLDGSETRADLIDRIERHQRRYERRDMQASE